jgi:Zn-dependent peptidase ImmA (M78 family)
MSASLKKPTVLDDRKTLILQGMKMAAQVRQELKYDQAEPICVYDACEKKGVSVRFNDINMEGMYVKSARSDIHISALRPFARRNFTCAHELGHHVFGHGSTFDELRDDQLRYSNRPPEEVLADSFAASFLMPPLGVRKEFRRRGLNPNTASATEIYFVACHFGVGQATLVNHLAYTLQVISSQRRSYLGKFTPKKIRTEILGQIENNPLTVSDKLWNAPFLDIEKDTFLLLPEKTVVDVNILRPEFDVSMGKVFKPIRTGITRVVVPNTSWATFVRVSKKQYVGLARYRHFEEDDEE